MKSALDLYLTVYHIIALVLIDSALVLINWDSIGFLCEASYH